MPAQPSAFTSDRKVYLCGWVADVDFAEDSVPVIRKHDAAVGVQEHLKHRTRPQRGADDVGDSLWIKGSIPNVSSRAVDGTAPSVGRFSHLCCRYVGILCLFPSFTLCGSIQDSHWHLHLAPLC